MCVLFVPNGPNFMLSTAHLSISCNSFVLTLIYYAVAPVPAAGPVFLWLESRQQDFRLLRLSRLTRTLLKGQQVLGGTTVTGGAL